MPKHLLFIFTLVLFAFPFNSGAQILSIEQLIDYPLAPAEKISSDLVKGGWHANNIEIVPDSNFIRRSWETEYKKSGVKWYFLFYEFTKDTSENYVVYQFSDKDAFLNYKKELKDKGYKWLNPEKKKRRKNADDNFKKEKDDLFYHEDRHSLTVVKEVFLYGLYSFLVYSYRPHSAIAKHEIHTKTKVEVE
jgi:hypothetical protein